MLEILKTNIDKVAQKWLQEIKENGECRIDITEELEKVSANSISHVCFGRDVSDDTFDWLYYDPKDGTWTEKKVGLRVAIRNMIKLCLTKLYKDLSSPLTSMPKILIDMGIEVNIRSFDRKLWENKRRL